MSWKKEKGQITVSIHLYSALETIDFSPNGKGRGSITLASPQLVSNKETPWSHLFVPHSSLCFIFFTLGPFYVVIETFDSFSNPPSNEYQLLICLSSIIWILIFHILRLITHILSLLGSGLEWYFITSLFLQFIFPPWTFLCMLQVFCPFSFGGKICVQYHVGDGILNSKSLSAKAKLKKLCCKVCHDSIQLVNDTNAQWSMTRMHMCICVIYQWSMTQMRTDVHWCHWPMCIRVIYQWSMTRMRTDVHGCHWPMCIRVIDHC